MNKLVFERQNSKIHQKMLFFVFVDFQSVQKNLYSKSVIRTLKYNMYIIIDHIILRSKISTF